MKKKKSDTSKNSMGLEEKIQAQREKEKRLYPLRIDSRTVILVRKSNCNEAYAEEYRKKWQKCIMKWG